MKFSRQAATLVFTTALALSPGAPSYADQVRDSQWFTNYLNLDQAHRITKGNGVRVAVIDSGVTPHVDLAKNVKKGTDTIPGGDGFGQIDAKDGHGTKMAGLIAAHGHGPDNGAIGIAPESEIYPIKAVGATDNGEGVINGLKWAATNEIDIINLSVTIPRSRALNEAIDSALRADSVIIAGVGNKSENLQLGYPAAASGVLAVGAVDENGNHANFSVTGPEVAICAPGVNIVTPTQKDKYYKGSGTSQATAIVSGAAALIRAKFPELSAPEVIHRLTATAKDNGPPGRDDQCGYGVLDIVKALTADVPPNAPSVGPTSVTPTSAPSDDASASASTTPMPEAPKSLLPAAAGIGAAITILGGIFALLARRRRRSQSPTPAA